jgi:hypothetical protein
LFSFDAGEPAARQARRTGHEAREPGPQPLICWSKPEKGARRRGAVNPGGGVRGAVARRGAAGGGGGGGGAGAAAA